MTLGSVCVSGLLQQLLGHGLGLWVVLDYVHLAIVWIELGYSSVLGECFFLLPLVLSGLFLSSSPYFFSSYLSSL